MLGRVLLLVALAVLGGCAKRNTSPPTQRQQRIARLQDFALEKGFPRTGNFRRGAPDKEAYFLCYYTRPFALPDSYDDLGYRESSASGCNLPAGAYDVYFHKVEAVAFEDTPVTASMEAASEERALMVAAHEEVHEDPQLSRLPHPVAEAASTLLGFLTASEFARREGDLVTATRLSGDAVLYARKAEMVNRLHRELRALYAQHRQGQRDRQETLVAKQRLFARAEEECAGFGRGHSIHACLPASNNAGLAFDHSYTRWYPPLFALFQACQADLDTFLKELRALGGAGKRDLPAFARRLQTREEELRLRRGGGPGSVPSP
ncbi:MAG: aminopeptidase [Bryobacterales bacterium]|jgi:predicted aminopeptidase|nr:aminopeptidase [Bryobacterales bacterium]